MRNYRVAASCFEPDESNSLQDRRDALCDHLETLIAEQKPDLVVLPECALVPDFRKLPNYGAEPLGGPTVSLITNIARIHTTNICLPIIEDAGDRKYNTAVFVDRTGRIEGEFRKYVPTKAELDLGIYPGELGQAPVQLDGLRIGTAICFDENYLDLLWHWFEMRVDLLLFPSYTFGGKLVASWALTCGVPLISVFPWEAAIYDRDGSLLVDGGTLTPTIGHFKAHPPWIACNLNMQSRIYHLDKNMNQLSVIAKTYGDKVDIRLMVREAHMQLTVRDDSISIEQIEKEMHLISMYDYILGVKEFSDTMRWQ